MLLSSTGVLIRNSLPELEMQVSAEVVLKYLLATTGMLQRTSGHCWQAQIAEDPPALACALRALTGRFEVCAVLCCAALRCALLTSKIDHF